VEAGGRVHLRTHEAALAVAARGLAARAPRAVAAATRRVEGVEAQVRALDPARTLARGWSITRDAQGRVVRSPAAVAPGDRLVTTVAEGELHSTVDTTDRTGKSMGKEA
jgi:exodeoxyribonuclease VII large subunit